MIVVSNAMIVIWIKIIIVQSVEFDKQGQALPPSSGKNTAFWSLYTPSEVKDNEDLGAYFNTLDVYSELYRLHKVYILLASLCSALTFWRIFQFF
jgi:hypothetical protein